MNGNELKRSMKIISISVLIYALLVAGHDGEFWPFSIYPMFSQAGNQWTRAMIIDVSDLPDESIWEVHEPFNRIGPAVPVGKLGVDQIDFSNFISKTDNWTVERRSALIDMFGTSQVGQNRWIAAKVQGELIGSDSVSIQITPFLLITADNVFLNPYLDSLEYFERYD